MEIQNDFKDLLALFNAHKVDYLVVGGYALAFHGSPRYTGDLDLLIRSTAANAERILTALTALGFGSLNLESEDFEKPDTVIQLGVPPVRVDLLTSLTGVTWKDAFESRIQGKYGDNRAFLILPECDSMARRPYTCPQRDYPRVFASRSG